MKRILALLVFLAACCGGTEPTPHLESDAAGSLTPDSCAGETASVSCVDRCDRVPEPSVVRTCLAACEPCVHHAEPTPLSCASWCDGHCSERAWSEGRDADWLADCFDLCVLGTAGVACTESPDRPTGCGGADR